MDSKKIENNNHKPLGIYIDQDGEVQEVCPKQKNILFESISGFVAVSVLSDDGETLGTFSFYELKRKN